MAKEIWKDVVGYEGLYEVSDLGNVKSVDRQVRHPKGGVANKKGKPLAAQINKDGYARVPLWREGVSKYAFVGRLVLEAFVGPCPFGMECCHEDGIPANNVANNLRWDTHVANAADKVGHGTAQRGEKVGNSKLTDEKISAIRDGLLSGMTGVALAKKFNVTTATISRVKLGQSWSHVDV